jgi:Zn-dependent protease
LAGQTRVGTGAQDLAWLVVVVVMFGAVVVLLPFVHSSEFGLRIVPVVLLSGRGGSESPARE